MTISLITNASAFNVELDGNSSAFLGLQLKASRILKLQLAIQHYLYRAVHSVSKRVTTKEVGRVLKLEELKGAYSHTKFSEPLPKLRVILINCKQRRTVEV